jgi:hypothetical protein
MAIATHFPDDHQPCVDARPDGQAYTFLLFQPGIQCAYRVEHP